MHKQIGLAYRFLESKRLVDFSDIRDRSFAEELSARHTAARVQTKHAEQFKRIETNFVELREEAKRVVSQVQSCLEILRPAQEKAKEEGDGGWLELARRGKAKRANNRDDGGGGGSGGGSGGGGGGSGGGGGREAAAAVAYRQEAAMHLSGHNNKKRSVAQRDGNDEGEGDGDGDSTTAAAAAAGTDAGAVAEAGADDADDADNSDDSDDSDEDWYQESNEAARKRAKMSRAKLDARRNGAAATVAAAAAAAGPSASSSSSAAASGAGGRAAAARDVIKSDGNAVVVNMLQECTTLAIDGDYLAQEPATSVFATPSHRAAQSCNHVRHHVSLVDPYTCDYDPKMACASQRY